MLDSFVWTVEHLLGPDWSTVDYLDKNEFPAGALNRFLWELGNLWYKAWLHIPICVSRSHCLACRKFEPNLTCHAHEPKTYWWLNTHADLANSG